MASALTITNPSAEDYLNGWTVSAGGFGDDDVHGGVTPYRGDNFFRADGALDSVCEMYQDLAVPSGEHATIDAGSGAFRVQWAQANPNSDGDGYVELEFFDSGMVSLGTDRSAEITVTPEGTWEIRRFSGAVPVNTRTIRLKIGANKLANIYADTCFDSIAADVNDPDRIAQVARVQATALVRSTSPAIRVARQSVAVLRRLQQPEITAFPSTLLDEGFEQGNSDRQVPPTGWYTSGPDGGFEVWETTAGGLEPHSGSFFVEGEAGNDMGISRDINLALAGLPVSDLDTKRFTISLTAWQANMYGDDQGQVRVQFLDANGDAFGAESETPLQDITPEDSWQQVSLGPVTVPIGARFIRVTLRAVLVAGSTANACFDDVVLTVNDDGPGLPVTSRPVVFVIAT